MAITLVQRRHSNCSFLFQFNMQQTQHITDIEYKDAHQLLESSSKRINYKNCLSFTISIDGQ